MSHAHPRQPQDEHPWLVTGANGMLGRDLLARMASHAIPTVGLTRRDLDITDADAVRATFARHQPSVVLNCAAYTAVDQAENEEDAALRGNRDGPRHLADAAAAHGARLLHLSTDYVFSGKPQPAPYPEDATPAPATTYGRAKRAGERAVLDAHPDGAAVVRTAWLYGAHGPNFVRTMLRLEAERDTVDVVDDQHGQPTWTVDLAERLIRLGHTDAVGVWHATSSGETTWYDLAREVFRLRGADPQRVRPTDSAALPRPAPRPAYSVLGHARWAELGLPEMRDWQDALAEAFPVLDG